MFTPQGCIRAAIAKGLPTGWEYSDAAHGLFNGDKFCHVEAEAKGRSFIWTAFNADLDWKEFPKTKLVEAMAWAAA